VVWKLDRLARSTRQLLETVELLEQRKIGLKAITQSIDTTNAGGRLIFTVFGAIAEFEREIIRERTRAGLDAARSRGRTGGRQRALSDKDLTQARTLLADPEITVEDVARRLGVGPSTLYRYLPAARHVAQGEPT
ncbi:MAG: recombinase family protein, partial [Steroidobacteraceae bacterium]